MKQILGWDIDKNIADFESVALGLRADGQKSRSDAMFYLMARLAIAEKILKDEGLIDKMTRN